MYQNSRKGLSKLWLFSQLRGFTIYFTETYLSKDVYFRGKMSQINDEFSVEEDNLAEEVTLRKKK